MKYLATIFAMTILVHGTSQQFPYTFQTWDAKNGLSSSYCNTVIQGEQGYLYIGTNNGLYIFNGRDFKPFTYSTNSNYTREGNVEDLIIDDYNRLWFASVEYGVGLIHLNELNRQVQYFKPGGTQNDSLQDSKVSRLCFDSKGNLWVGTRGNGLFRFDTAAKKFEAVPTDNPTSLYNKYIRSFYLHNQDSLFVGLINGMSIINLKTGAASHVKFLLAETGKSLRPTIRKVEPVGKDSFLLATDRGTFWLKLSEQKLSSLYTNKKENIDFKDINSNDITRLSNKEVWIATENDGIIFFNKDTRTFDYSYLLADHRSGISKNFVSKLYKDKAGNIWIAQQSGLGFFQTTHARFNNFSFTDKDIFSGSFLSYNNNLLCLNGSSVTNINTQTGNVQTKSITIPGQKNQIPSCAAIYSPTDCILFCFDNFFRLNLKTLKVKQLPLRKEKIDTSFFKHFRIMQCIADTINGKKEFVLLAKTSNGNLLLNYDPDSGDLTEFIANGLNGDDLKTDYSHIEKAGNGKYWISTANNGLIYTVKGKRSIQYAANAKNERHKIPNGAISDFELTSEKDIWLLINKTGLVHIQFNEDEILKYEIFAEEHGLTDKRLFDIIADNNQNLWITSNSALFCFKKAEKEFFRYSVMNGLGNIKFNVNEIMAVRTTDGKIGLSDRVSNITWFNPLASDIPKPALIFTNILVNNQPTDISGLSSNLRFSYSQNNISFFHDIIDFDKTRSYKVLYRLENFDKEWNIAGQSNEQRYMHLPPGNYIYRIKLEYANGSSSPEKVVQFTIATVWYKTWWFKTIVALLCMTIIYLVIQNYVNRKLYEQKKELELQNAVALERARISTELHDDLGSGLSTIRILSQSLNGSGDNIGKNPNLEKISSHSHELIQKMREIVWALNNENDTLDQLISYIRLQASTLLDNAGISYQYQIPECIPEIKVTGGNRRHIHLLVKEAVHNIVKHARATEVLFTVTITEVLTVAIHDDGIGIPTGCTHVPSGNGIKNMKKHAEVVQGLLAIENHIGTTIQFSVPLQSLSHESVI